MDEVQGAGQEPRTVADRVVDMTANPPRTRQERKEQGWCTYGACSRRAQDDHQMCGRHRTRANARNRRWTNAMRSELADQGKCRRCRKPSSTVRCPACRILDGAKLPRTVADRVVDTRASGVAAATRTHEDGRTRYHGQQKRGQQPKWQLNLQDLHHVTEEFQRFSDCIKILATPEAQQRHKSDRITEELATAHVGERMCRRMDDILERLGHFKQRHGKRDGEP